MHSGRSSRSITHLSSLPTLRGRGGGGVQLALGMSSELCRGGGGGGEASHENEYSVRVMFAGGGWGSKP